MVSFFCSTHFFIKTLIFSIILFSSSNYIQANKENFDILKPAKEFIEAKEYKQAISYLEKLLGDSKYNSEKVLRSRIQLELAIAYYKDQELEESFLVFLESLNDLPISSNYNYSMSEEEKEHYQKAEDLYYAQNEHNGSKIAAEIEKTYLPVIEAHPDFYALNYLLAAAYANLGKYDRFFESFYRSYLYAPHYYLAYKAKGVLYLKLKERGKTSLQQQKYQKQALENFELSLDLNPYDHMVYKMLIMLSQESNRHDNLVKYLNQMLAYEIPIPRLDIYFYTYHCCLYREYNLAQKGIDQARKIYKYSRTIEEAQEYLNQAIIEDQESNDNTP